VEHFASRGGRNALSCAQTFIEATVAAKQDDRGGIAVQFFCDIVN